MKTVYVIESEEDEDTVRDHFTLIPNKVFELGLSAHAFSLLFDIYIYLNESGKDTDDRPIESLAAWGNMSKARVTKALEQLKEKGVIEITSGGIHVKEDFSAG